MFFIFLDKMMVKELWKTTKTQGFFGFWVFVALVFFGCAMKNQKKTLSFFGFSHFFNHHFIQKNKKHFSFLVFSRSRPKKQKNLGKTNKNQTWASDQTFSEKFCFFVFFWFSRGLGYFVFPKIQPKSRKL